MADLTRDDKIELLKLLEERERRLAAKTTRTVTAGMTAAPEDIDIRQMAREEVMREAEQIESAGALQNPAQIARPRDVLPEAGAAAATMLVPGGLPLRAAIAAQGLAGGLGNLFGQAGQRTLEGRPLDRSMAVPALIEGAASAGGAGVAGAIGKGAKLLFGSGSPEQAAQRAINYAQKKGLPFPSFAARDSVGGELASLAAGSVVGGDIAERNAAQRAQQYIDAGIESMRQAKGKRPVDVSANTGRQWLADTLASAKEAGNQAFERMKNAVGTETPVDASDVAASIRSQLTKWDQAGLGAKYADNPSYRQLKQFADGDGQVAFGDLEALRRSAQELSKKAAGEERVWKGADSISDAVIEKYLLIGKDIDKNIVGMLNFAREKTKIAGDLSRIKDAVRLSKPGAKPWTWLNDAVSNPQLMALMRERSPQTYAQVLDGWFDNQVSRFAKPGEPINGKAFRDFVVRNKQIIRNLYGGKQAQVMDNLSRYAQFSADEIAQYAKKSRTAPMIGSALAAGGTMFGGMPTGASVGIIEIPAYVLSKGLRDPNSPIFKLFSQPMPKIMSDLGFKTLVISSQQVPDVIESMQ